MEITAINNTNESIQFKDAGAIQRLLSEYHWVDFITFTEYTAEAAIVLQIRLTWWRTIFCVLSNKYRVRKMKWFKDVIAKRLPNGLTIDLIIVA